MSDRLDTAREAHVVAVAAADRLASVDETIATVSARRDTHLDEIAELRYRLSLQQAEANWWHGWGGTQIAHALVFRLGTNRRRRDAEVAATVRRLGVLDAVGADVDRELDELRSVRATAAQDAGWVESCLAALLDAIAAEEPAAFDRLSALEPRRAEAATRCDEIRQALDAARSARLAIDSAARHMDTAAYWGGLDSYGGRRHSIAKRDEVREGLAAVRTLHASLVRLETELGDVRIPVPSGLDPGDVAWNADVLFDNVVSDVRMQGRIDQMARNLAALDDRVATVEADLEQRHGQATTERRQLETEIAALLAGGEIS